ncbi:MAG: class III signal peptide-containing protein [Euryarchaeota archaeon]|nr:class III signal peptide-containing protein [Euryarchaeota archaeon]
MFERLLREERAQGGMEYILLVGGVIVAATVTFAVYSSMTKSAAAALNETTNESVAKLREKTLEALDTF